MKKRDRQVVKQLEVKVRDISAEQMAQVQALVDSAKIQAEKEPELEHAQR